MGMVSHSRRSAWLRRMRAIGLACAGFACLQVPLDGQSAQGVDPADRAKIHLGPFYLHPTVSLRDIGIDTNVFNQSEAPQEDFTLTIAPALDAGLRAGPVRLTSVGAVEYVWFQTFESERSFNGTGRGRLEIRWTRLRPFGSAEAQRTSARQGDEIDARARRSGQAYAAGVDLLLASRTWATVEYRHLRNRYAKGERYEGVDLSEALDGTTESVSAGLRLELTPLTTLAVRWWSERARFETATVRDTDNSMITGTLAFDPDALLNGRATIGYRSLRAVSPTTPDYQGLTAAVDLGYVAPSSTRVETVVSRDVSYSFEDLYPYFMNIRLRFSLAQRIVGPFEVVGRAGWSWLDYRALVGVNADRTDRVADYGGGVRYRLGDFSHLGFEVAHVRRRSEVPARQYTGTRFFGSLDYGF